MMKMVKELKVDRSRQERELTNRIKRNKMKRTVVGPWMWMWILDRQICGHLAVLQQKKIPIG